MKDVQTVIISLWYSSSLSLGWRMCKQFGFLDFLKVTMEGERSERRPGENVHVCDSLSLSFSFFFFFFFFICHSVCVTMKRKCQTNGKHDKRYRADTARVCMRKCVCVCGRCTEKIVFPCLVNTAWCSEIGSLTSPMHATQVHPVTTENQFHCTRLYFKFLILHVSP